MDEIKKGRYYPKDQFSHGTLLLEGISGRFGIVDKQERLANVGDDYTLRFYQTDLHLLICLKELAEREPRLKKLAEVLETSWKDQLGITRAKDSNERKLQASISGYQPKKDASGFGSEFEYGTQEENTETTLLNRLMKKKK